MREFPTLLAYAGLAAIPLVTLVSMRVGLGHRLSDIQADLKVAQSKLKDHDDRLRELDKWV